MLTSNTQVIINRNFYNRQYYDTLAYGRMRYELPNRSLKESEHVSYRNQWDEWPKILRAINEICGNIKTILDIGCGCGYSIYKARENGFLAYGIDYSSSAIELGWNDRKHLLLADAANLPFKQGIFDLVLSSSVFEHIYSADIEAVLEQIKYVAKRWIFLNIDGSVKFPEYELLQNEVVPDNLMPEAIKGHVMNKPYRWWKDVIQKYFVTRDDLVNKFLEIVPDSFSPLSFKFICERKT